MENICPEYLRITMPSMPWPHGRTITLGTGQQEKDTLYEVSHQEPWRHRKAVEKIAYYFRREFGYDFPPYTTNRTKEEECVFMWIGLDFDWSGNEKAVAYGACGFLREPHEYWGLAWVWMHPYERRKGHLSMAWPYFQERFGTFLAYPPYSPEMKAFLSSKREGDPDWLRQQLAKISTIQ